MSSITAFSSSQFILCNGHAGLGANLTAQPLDCCKNEVAIETLEIVTDNKDPDKLARSDAPALQNLPEVEDQVLVTFEHGDPRQPLILGLLWNSGDKPPQSR